MESRPRDIYGRKPVSQSRGRTHERILALQHDADTIPGAEHLLPTTPEPGSLAAAIRAFHHEWVAARPVTGRRAYERSLALLTRDLASNGPALDEPAAALDEERARAHLAWRAANGMAHESELPRSAVTLARLLEHIAGERLDEVRERLRAAAAELAADAEPGANPTA